MGLQRHEPQAARSVVVMSFHSSLGSEHSDVAERDVLSKEVVVLLEGSESFVERVVRGTVVLLEGSKLLSHLRLTLDHSVEVLFGEDTIVGNPVVPEAGLIIVSVLKAGCV